MQGYAIVGMACRYPGIKDTSSYWQALVNGESLLREMTDSWSRLYYNKDQDRSNPRESYSTIYTKKYGSIADNSWIDSLRFAFPPNLVEGDPSQYLCLQVAAEAMADALRGRAPEWIPHERTGVVVGMGDHPHRGIVGALMNGMIMEHFIDVLADSVGAVLKGERRKQLRSLLSSTYELVADPAITPNLISNVVSGTIANRLGLLGPNYLVDGACTSGMIAVDHAIKQLDAGDADLMLVGGVQATMNFPIYQLFCTINALSEEGIFPMSKSASGTLLSEGVGFIALKRLSDAVKSGDTIYSVIRSVALASDGKGEGLLAPNRQGQVVAMKRAYEKCDIKPSDVSLVEVHATGIPHGDNTELSSMLEVFADCHRGLSTIAIGSIKSLIGHTIPASGVASLIKISLALQNKLIPPSICPDPLEAVADHSTPFYINRTLRRWFHSPAKPRVAAINSFGFGGINGHLLLQEFIAPNLENPAPSILFPCPASGSKMLPDSAGLSSDNDSSGRTYRGLLQYRHHGYTTTGRAIFLAATSRSELQELMAGIDVEAIHQAVLFRTPHGHDQSSGVSVRLVIFASSLKKLGEGLQDASSWLAGNVSASSHRGRHFIYSESVNPRGKIAFLVPGEGVQAPEMLSDLTNNIDLFSYWYNFMDEALDREIPLGLVTCMPNADLSCTQSANAKRMELLYAQDSATQIIAACLMSFYEIASRIGLRPDQIIGHSQGESNAVMLSGSLATMKNQDDLKTRVKQIHEFFSKADSIDEFPEGSTFAISGLDTNQLKEILKRRPEWSLISDNCRSQRIVFSEAAFSKELEEQVLAAGGSLLPTPLTRPYHTRYFKQGAETHRKLYSQFPHSIQFEPDHATVYSCLTTQPYPNDYERGTQIFIDQWLNPVRYEETIRNMYDDGARYFIELGPNTTLTSYTKEALSAYSDIVAVSLGTSRKDSTTALLQSVAILWTSGLDLDLEGLDGLFIERYRTGLATVTRPAAAVPVLSEIPQYNSVGLGEFLASVSSDSGPPPAGRRRESSAQTFSDQGVDSLTPVSEESMSPGNLTMPSTSASPAPGVAQQDPVLGRQLLLEHSRTILTMLASADSTSKQIFNQVD
jgi:acyl transferase domain-containing protein